MAKVIHPNGSHYDLHPANNGKLTLEQMQEAIGGYIAIVPTSDPKIVLIVDEEGLLKRLPVNDVATRMIHPSYMANGEPPITGTVIVAHRDERN